jgi:hypothetical protein
MGSLSEGPTANGGVKAHEPERASVEALSTRVDNDVDSYFIT